MTVTGPIAAIQRTIRRRLPKLIRKSIADYVAFAATPPPADAKGFSTHQTACKSALAHLEAATKVLAWAEDPGDGPNQSDELVRMIHAAKTTIAAAEQSDV